MTREAEAVLRDRARFRTRLKNLEEARALVEFDRYCKDYPVEAHDVR